MNRKVILIKKACESVRNAGKWAELDSNKTTQRLINKDVTENDHSKTVQKSMQILQIHPELQQIIEAWPKLSKQQRQAILILSNFDFSK